MLLVLPSLFLWNHFHLRCNYLCVGPNKILIQTPFYAIFQSPLNGLKSGICNVYAFKLKGMQSTTIFRNYYMYNVLWFYGCMFFYLHNWITGHIFTSVSARFAIYIPLFLPISFTYLRLFLPGLRSTFPCSCPSVSHIHVCFCQVSDLHSPVPAHQFHIFTSVSARFAIYIPLFLPISFPVLASLWQAYKWWRGQDKPKQEWQHNSTYGFFLYHELFCLTSCVMAQTFRHCFCVKNYNSWLKLLSIVLAEEFN